SQSDSVSRRRGARFSGSKGSSAPARPASCAASPAASEPIRTPSRAPRSSSRPSTAGDDTRSTTSTSIALSRRCGIRYFCGRCSTARGSRPSSGSTGSFRPVRATRCVSPCATPTENAGRSDSRHRARATRHGSHGPFAPVSRNARMGLIVQKYGGTSVADLDRIRNVARRVARTRAQGHDVVVVVSAMAGDTNRLIALGKDAASQPNEREMDAMVATGEQVTAALTAIVLEGMGTTAQSFMGHQVRIATDSAYMRARIRRIDDESLRAVLARGAVAVVAGFQGVDDTGSITTLGRGGSDTSAVALAAALKADVCEIYTDVDGVYTADPRIVPKARKLARIAHDEMLELASLGAKVLQIRSVEFAKRYGVKVHVRSSFNDSEGTWVVEEDPSMEEVTVSGVAADLNQAKLTLVRVPDRPGIAAHLFGPIAEAGIVVDMI